MLNKNPFMQNTKPNAIRTPHFRLNFLEEVHGPSSLSLTVDHSSISAVRSGCRRNCSGLDLTVLALRSVIRITQPVLWKLVVIRDTLKHFDFLLDGNVGSIHLLHSHGQFLHGILLGFYNFIHTSTFLIQRLVLLRHDLSKVFLCLEQGIFQQLDLELCRKLVVGTSIFRRLLELAHKRPTPRSGTSQNTSIFQITLLCWNRLMLLRQVQEIDRF
mmetsp:Transcript_47497/g.70697  ORF Transcript_47497/g.70697 Transcript_47497/m.70697 type:complete len:215 (-) Transcript_47497:1624-2268(-)